MLRKIIESLKDIKEGELVTRTYKNGEIIEEKREQIDWELTSADLDIVLVECKGCGNQFDTPWDTLMFLNDPNSQCGQCGKSGTFEVIASPSPNMFRLIQKHCKEKVDINGNAECEHRRKIISGLNGCLCNKENCYKMRGE